MYSIQLRNGTIKLPIKIKNTTTQTEQNLKLQISWEPNLRQNKSATFNIFGPLFSLSNKTESLITNAALINHFNKLKGVIQDLRIATQTIKFDKMTWDVPYIYNESMKLIETKFKKSVETIIILQKKLMEAAGKLNVNVGGEVYGGSGWHNNFSDQPYAYLINAYHQGKLWVETREQWRL